MNDLKSHSSQQTKELIQQTFVACYLKQPFQKITVSNLVERCHIARGTFYLYYADLTKLLAELENEMIAGISQNMNAVIIHAARRDEASYVAEYTRMLQYISENHKIFQALLFGSERASFLDKYRACIAGNVRTLFEVDHSIPESLREGLCNFHAGGIVALLTRWFESGMMQSPEELASIVYRALFYGLCGDSGQN